MVLTVLGLSDFLGMFRKLMRDGSVHAAFLLIVFCRTVFSKMYLLFLQKWWHKAEAY